MAICAPPFAAQCLLMTQSCAPQLCVLDGRAYDETAGGGPEALDRACLLQNNSGRPLLVPGRGSEGARHSPTMSVLVAMQVRDSSSPCSPRAGAPPMRMQARARTHAWEPSRKAACEVRHDLGAAAQDCRPRGVRSCRQCCRPPSAFLNRKLCVAGGLTVSARQEVAVCHTEIYILEITSPLVVHPRLPRGCTCQ